MDKNTETIFDEEDMQVEEGMESEEDLGKQDSSVYSKAVIWGTDWTSETIVSQLKKKNIDLNPDFQRRDAWNPAKKSKFIESLILGLPVPPIILAERKDKKNSYLVIDGKQRLLTIMQFCTSEDDKESGFETLFLKNLEILHELNGSNYSKIALLGNSSEYVNQFDNQSIRAIVIRNWPNEEFLYTVFLRFNTGSLTLSPQELRQALHPGDFLTYVNKYTESQNPVWEILRINKPDSRMRDIELITRYFAFKNFLPNYKNSLKDFLDEACSEINKDWNTNSKTYINQLENLEKAIDFSKDVFGKNAFTKYIKNEYSHIFNRTIFDLMVYYFSEKEIREKLENKKPKVKAMFENLMTKNKKFIESVRGSTKDGEKTFVRFKIFGEELKKLG